LGPGRSAVIAPVAGKRPHHRGHRARGPLAGDQRPDGGSTGTRPAAPHSCVWSVDAGGSARRLSTEPARRASPAGR